MILSLNDRTLKDRYSDSEWLIVPHDYSFNWRTIWNMIGFSSVYIFYFMMKPS